MKSEYHRRSVVKPGGQVEVSVPELRDGEEVEVVVRAEVHPARNGKRPGFGNARGMIRMSEDFDKPLSDFSEYQ